MESTIKRLKAILIGDIKVGKSSLARKYCDRSFQWKYIPTSGVNCSNSKTATIANQRIMIDFIDMSGNPNFHKVRSDFYAGTRGALMIFDITNKKSFISLTLWFDEIYQEMELAEYYRTTIVVCGNKIDLTSKRKVSSSAAYYWAKERGLPYFEISAKDNIRVDQVFESLIRSMLQSEELWNDNFQQSVSLLHKIGPITPVNISSTAVAVSELICRLTNGADNYNKIGLRKGATRSQVNKAFRKLAVLLHPDKNTADGAEEAFKELTKVRLELLTHLD